MNGNISFKLEQMISDDHRGYLLLIGTIEGYPCTLVNVYCPNIHQPTFLSQVLTKLSDFATRLVIIAGDINMPLDPVMDTFHGLTYIPCKRLAYIRKDLHEVQLIDVWRVLHPKTRDYSYSSKTHDSYSKIDNIFIDLYHLPMLQSASIGAVSFSDHAPVSIC